MARENTLLDNDIIDARERVSGPCTLDGHPATLGGVFFDLAHVQKVGSPYNVRFNWTEAARVMLHEAGAFFTPDSQKAGGSGRIDGRNGKPSIPVVESPPLQSSSPVEEAAKDAAIEHAIEQIKVRFPGWEPTALMLGFGRAVGREILRHLHFQ